VGWLKPTIVFPVAALAGLSPAQIEALLAHELAHVRRHDYLVNLLQSFVEVVLFYHPAIWWLSRRVRIERELCCDDEAVGICDRLVYATALTDLAAMRAPRVALAATGGDLLARVRRILGREESSMSARARWVPALIAFATIIAAVPVLIASVRTPAVPVASTEEARIVAAEPVTPEGPTPTLSEIEDAQQPSASDLERRIAELRQMMEASEAEIAATTQDRERVERLEQTRREMEERARAVEIETARKELERIRRMFETGLVPKGELADAELRLALIEANGDERRQREIEIERAQRRLEDARRRFEAGVVTKDEVSKLESQIAMLQAMRGRSESMEQEATVARRQLERTRELVDRGLAPQRDLQRAEDVLKQFERESRSFAAQTERGLANQREQEAKFRELVDRTLRERGDQDRLYRERMKEMLDRFEGQKGEYEKLLMNREAEALRERLDVRREVSPELRSRAEVARNESLESIPSRPIQAGDMLFITIEGENLLPTIYRIESNGAIRLPLLGSFKVIGQTPGQVRETIGKRLMDAKLGSPAKVRVELRRQRDRAPER
jgi:multidrug resistance efflux pump